MNSVIEKFGRIVDGQIADHPARSRRLLTTAYRLNGWAGKHILKKTTPSRLALSDACNGVIIRPLEHPQESAMVSLFTPCELLQTFGMAPMFPEALSAYLSGAGAERGFIDAVERRGIPETFCSYHKILLGAAETGVLPNRGLFLIQPLRVMPTRFHFADLRNFTVCRILCWMCRLSRMKRQFATLQIS